MVQRRVLPTLVFHVTEGCIRMGSSASARTAFAGQAALYAVCWCVVAVAVILVDRKAWRFIAASATADR